MPRRLPSLLLLGLAAAALNGCYAGAHHHHVHASHGLHGGGDLAFVAVAGLVAGAAIASAAEHEHVHHREPEPVYYQPVVYVNVPPQPASPRDQVRTNDAVGFDAKSARAALGAVDLAACRDAGAPRGYGHAKVTFNPDGAASKVVVDTPDGLSDPAVKCIGDRLGSVNVPPYQGNYVTVGTTWFVP